MSNHSFKKGKTKLPSLSEILTLSTQPCLCSLTYLLCLGGSRKIPDKVRLVLTLPCSPQQLYKVL